MRNSLLHMLILLVLFNCKRETEKTKSSENIIIQDTSILKEKTISKTKIEVKDSSLERKSLIKKDSTIHNLFTVSNIPNHIKETLNLNFQKISEKDFLINKKAFNDKISKEKVIQDDSTKFILKSSKSVYQLHKGGVLSSYPRADYYGYLKPINSYIIGSGGDGIYHMFLLDKSTDIVTSISYFTDYNGNLPRISPDNSKLISFELDFDQNSYIVLYKINNSKISSYQAFETDKWVINDIIWLDNKNIALKICEEIEYKGNSKTNCIGKKYIKTKIE